MYIFYLFFVFLVNWLIFSVLNHKVKHRIYLVILLILFSIIIHLIGFLFIKLISIEEFFNLIFPSIALLVIYYMGVAIERRFEKTNNSNPEMVQYMLKISRFIRNKVMIVLTPPPLV